MRGVEVAGGGASAARESAVEAGAEPHAAIPRVGTPHLRLRRGRGGLTCVTPSLLQTPQQGREAEHECLFLRAVIMFLVTTD